MAPADPFPFHAEVREVAAMLARGEYAALERLSEGVRLSADEIADAIVQYPATIAVPPPEVELPLDVVEHTGAEPRAWSVNVPLRSATEGFSDLTLELTVREGPIGAFVVEIDNLHAL